MGKGKKRPGKEKEPSTAGNSDGEGILGSEIWVFFYF